MDRAKSLITVLDSVGVAALLAAALAMTVVYGIVVVVPPAAALQVFTVAFIGAIGAFSSARILQLGYVMRTRTDPRRAREARARLAPQPEVAHTSEAAPVPNPLQRAA